MVLILSITAALVIGLYLYLGGMDPSVLILLTGPVALFAFFYSVEVVVDRYDIRLIYGVGLFSRAYALSEIVDRSVVRNEAIACWVYQPLQDQLLMLKFRSGKRVAIPTRQPKKLSSLLSVKG